MGLGKIINCGGSFQASFPNASRTTTAASTTTTASTAAAAKVEK